MSRRPPGAGDLGSRDVRATPGDHVLTLRDGRRLGYAVYGDPDGSPVLNCHGGLVSGHDVAPADRLARSLGWYVISPDRPGIARTDRLPGHGVLPWVDADVVPLLDHLGVDRFAAMGWSEGGQYALATSVTLADRVTACAVIAGCVPLDDAEMLAQSNRVDRTFVLLARRLPPALWITSTSTRLLARWAPGVLVRSALDGEPEGEHAALYRQGSWFADILGEGAADAAGVVEEYRVIVAPWGFAPEDVTVPVGIFQGTADPVVPPAWGDTLAERIPGAELTVFPGEGHFISVTRRREVLEWLGADGRRPAAD